MPSPWCAWCGRVVDVGVIVANMVIYHPRCWERRARLLDPRQNLLHPGHHDAIYKPVSRNRRFSGYAECTVIGYPNLLGAGG